MKKLFSIGLALLVIGCGGETISDVETTDDTTAQKLDWMEEHADDYLHDASWRRTQMEDALWRPELPYARKRLSGYARGERGWDLLPEMNKETARVTDPETGVEFQPRPVSTQRPTTREEWLALGEDVFWNMPMRAAPYLRWTGGQPQFWEEIGLETDGDGAVRGLARFETARGEEAVGATCGLCHGAGGVAGQAAEDLDLGKARAHFAEERGGDGTTFDTWPAGTIDVTDDGATDPVAIPDLWSVEENTHLNASGVIEMTTPAALAVRLETQYIVGHSLESRPNRVQIWALTMYVLSLESPEATDPEEAREDIGRGQELFGEHCANCHVPDRKFGGDLIAAESLTSDTLAARSAYRGTGFYKVPSLVGIGRGGPFLHDNSVEDLETLLELPHPYELKIDSSEREALLAYLHTL